MITQTQKRKKICGTRAGTPGIFAAVDEEESSDADADAELQGARGI